ncbi:unnamed protein product [Ectocarpus sp. 6 AP-2014]
MWRRTIVMALAACYSRCSGFMNFSKGVARVSSSLRLGDSRAKCSSHGTTIRGAAAVAAISGRCLGVRGGANRRLHATVPAAETPTSDTAAEKEASPVVSSLQAWMRKENMDCFIVPSDDPHLSEYASECFNRRAFVSGFTGSAGTAVILKDEALLWTDGRYHLQADQQLGKGWRLMKAGKPSVPTIEEFLAKQLPTQSRVAIDPFVHSASSVKALEKELGAAGISVAAIDHAGDKNPVDKIWGEARPAPPNSPVRIHKMAFAGETVKDKLAKIRKSMLEEKADVFVSGLLDEVAYILNIRGDDVAHSPVAIAYLLVTENGATVFINEAKMSTEVEAEMKEHGVEVHGYEEAIEAVRMLAKQGKKVWIDPERVNFAFANRERGGLAGHWRMNCRRAKLDLSQHATLCVCHCVGLYHRSLIAKPSPVSMAKGIKNAPELEGMRAAHVRDGVAMVLALSRLERDVAAGQVITEVDIDQRATTARSQQDKFVDLSFPTIAGENSNGAIIHYSATPDSCHTVGRESMLLLDSGAQYEDGTTDVTRTMHFGEPTAEQKEAYTRVLQGHIGLATAQFPDGTPGFMIDAFARRHLWDAGLDYQHGTGHGVGAALNVHEGPHSISSRTANTTPLEPGMIVSNEPGYYKPGSFGIRIENLLEIVDSGISNETLGRRFYSFAPLTFIPMQKKLLDQTLLTSKELDWLDEYHEMVWTKLHKLVQDEEALAWLKEATAPVVRQP